MGQITVMTGPERRRDVSTSLICTWRRNLQREHAEGASLPMVKASFAQAILAKDEKVDDCDRFAVISVELGEGRCVRISAEALAALVGATFKALG